MDLPFRFQSIVPEESVGSVNAIQTGLFRRYPNQKFLVTCATAETDEAGKAMAANKVHFSSGGDGYCNVVKERIWCQAVAISA